MKNIEPAEIVIRTPTAADGARVHELARRCPPLDVNSAYCYLLFCTHFAGTCTVAERSGKLIGFQTGYFKPGEPNGLFIWQIAVGPDGRGMGIAKRMVQSLLGRFAPGTVQYLEQTVTKTNRPSRALFESVAQELGAAVNESLMFGDEHFGPDSHEAEYLLRIGPIPNSAGTATNQANLSQGVY